MAQVNQHSTDTSAYLTMRWGAATLTVGSSFDRRSRTWVAYGMEPKATIAITERFGEALAQAKTVQECLGLFARLAGAAQSPAAMVGALLAKPAARPAAAPQMFKGCAVGSRVWAYYPTDQNWYAATLLGPAPKGRKGYQIEWEDAGGKYVTPDIAVYE